MVIEMTCYQLHHRVFLVNGGSCVSRQTGGPSALHAPVVLRHSAVFIQL